MQILAQLPLAESGLLFRNYMARGMTDKRHLFVDIIHIGLARHAPAYM